MAFDLFIILYDNSQMKNIYFNLRHNTFFLANENISKDVNMIIVLHKKHLFKDL